VIEAPIAIAQAAVGIFSALFDAAVMIVVASIASWKYVLSSTYRAQVNLKLSQRGALYRGAAKTGGALVVVLSIPAIVLIVWAVWRASRA
jgi:hypothetical protein